MPEGKIAAKDLRAAGPVWKNAGEPRPQTSNHFTVQRAFRPGEDVLSLASERGLRVRSLQMAENGTIRFIAGDLGGKGELTPIRPPAATLPSAAGTLVPQNDLQLAQEWLATFAPVMKIGEPVREFSLSRYETDELGMRHLRLQQMYRGVPVWANELYVHLDAGDRVYAVNGCYAPAPSGIDTDRTGITPEEAIRQCRLHLATQGLLADIPAGMTRFLSFSTPSAQKAVWIDGEGDAHLVWQVDLYASIRDWFTIMVDATTGEVLHRYANTMSEGKVNASGTDLSGTNRSFRAYEQNGTYYMLSDINELSGTASSLPDNPSGGLWVIDLRNTDASGYSQFYHVTSNSASSWNDHSAVSAIYHLGLVYTYYKNTHGRRAIDGAAATIITVVNVTEEGQPMDNAYWNGSAIFWGNGNTHFSPLAGALDVGAHELTHGITEYTANLIYQDQSGALNESMSDFFAAMVDRDDWLMGEDIMLPGRGTALRDLSNPHNPNVLSRLPMTMDEYVRTSEDYGGVHTNCGIPSYAAYLVANSIGRDKAERIYYRALTSYLTRQAQFTDARAAIEQSATDLYGSGTELNAVKTAFDAVKITTGGGGGTTPTGAGDNEVEATMGGSQWIAFVRDDLQVGLYDIANEVDYYLPDIRVKSKTGNWTEFTATADGRYLYFINENGVLARADLAGLPDSYDYETFPQYYIQQQGDLWNAAVSRDNQYVALTSVYENDNNIYLLIGGQMYYITLDIPSTQPGITSSTIIYPDVLNWSPNTKYPKLAFDAYNSITLSSGTRDWWSMGEIDFTGEAPQVYSMLPAQPEGISVGNVQYSSVDPDRIAFSTIDDNAHYWDIQILTFTETEQMPLLQFPNRDVERPSFSPDDRYIVIDRFSDRKLIILELSSYQYMILNLTSGARYPEWFVIGGNFDLDVESGPEGLPSEFGLEANYPNPFNAGTKISYTLPKESDVRVAIYDLNGRHVITLEEGVQQAGRHSVYWEGTGENGSSVASGIYFCRMEADGKFIASRKMVMVK